MGMVIIPMLIGLIYIGGLIARQVNYRVINLIDLADTWVLKIVNVVLRLIFIVPFAVLTFYILDANSPSGANGFGGNKSPWLFGLAPVLFGFVLTISKSFSYLIVSKLKKLRNN